MDAQEDITILDDIGGTDLFEVTKNSTVLPKVYRGTSGYGYGLHWSPSDLATFYGYMWFILYCSL